MKIMLNLIILLIVVYVAICGALYFYQDSFIFFPTQDTDEEYALYEKNEIQFEINNKKINGWKVPLDEKYKKTILYFGGNATDVIYLNDEAQYFNAQQLFAFNHPGYGKSEGQPSQKSLYENALNVYDFILEKYNLEEDNIIIVGRSLGSSVATYLAANRKVSGLVLITPFDSIENMAAEKYKLFPTSVLLKHKFPTSKYIVKVDKPILMLAVEEDEIIADASLQNLKNKANDTCELVRYSNVGHNTIHNHKDYYLEINRYLDNL